jgi:hypothetical protein
MRPVRNQRDALVEWGRNLKEFSKQEKTKWQRNKSYKYLKKVAETLTQSLSDKGKVSVTIEPGYEVNLGQQFNVVVRVPQKHYQEILFRAYVPSGNGRADLDFYDSNLVHCEDENEFGQKVLGFLNRDIIQRKLALLAEIASE